MKPRYTASPRKEPLQDSHWPAARYVHKGMLLLLLLASAQEGRDPVLFQDGPAACAPLCGCLREEQRMSGSVPYDCKGVWWVSECKSSHFRRFRSDTGLTTKD
jgi:hypothetical protein